jgi:hypothetical protein
MDKLASQVKNVDSRIVWLYKVLDRLNGALLLTIVIVAPWFLGLTTRMGVFFGNLIGCIIGVVWFLGWLLRNNDNHRENVLSSFKKTPLSVRCVYLLILVLLLYVLVSCLNAGAAMEYTFYPGFDIASGVEINYFDPIRWLPHSYAAVLSFKALFKYLSLASIFVGARDWFSRSEISKESIALIGGHLALPRRMVYYLWIVSLNTAILSLVAMVQRLDGSEKLLWHFDNHLNHGFGAFGPFPYQSNGAQYLNLFWPVMLGFWWVLKLQNRGMLGQRRRVGGDSHIFVLILVSIAAVGVVLTRSKGGVLVLLGLLLALAGLVVVNEKREYGVKFALAICFLTVLAVGGWLGGQHVVNRFMVADLDNLSGRKLIYEDSARMADDFLIFGSGAETFAPLYYFYRSKNPIWDAYVHNDYLETLITFGWVGLGIIICLFICIWLTPFFGDGVPVSSVLIKTIALAMGGVLVHARYDLPFQIYSLHLEFVVLCALLTCLRWRNGFAKY